MRKNLLVVLMGVFSGFFVIFVGCATKIPTTTQLSLPDFQVASYNVENLWDGNPANTLPDQLWQYEEFTPELSNWYGQGQSISSGYTTKALAAAKAIALMGAPDIVALQEIESARNESQVFSETSVFRKELEKLGYRYFLLGPQSENKPTALTTAVISKIPIQARNSIVVDVSHPSFSTLSEKQKKSVRWSLRDIQVVEVLHYDFLLINNHWRSQGCDSQASCEVSENVRQATAQVLNEYIAEHKRNNKSSDRFLSNTTKSLMVVGDFNMGWSSPVFKKMVMDQSLFNLWLTLDPQSRTEYNFEGHFETLSGFFLDKKMYQQLKQFRVHKEGLTNGDGNPLRWQSQKWNESDLAALKDFKALDSLKQAKILKDCLSADGNQQDQAKQNSRRCKIFYTYYPGVGFSDHFPLIASFQSVPVEGKTELHVEATAEPSKSQESKPRPPFVPCEPLSTKELHFSDHSDSTTMIGKCFTITGPKPLKTLGPYQSNYIDIDGHKVLVLMTNSYDPNHINQYITRQFLQEQKQGDIHQTQSLQDGGGQARLVSALGRFGFEMGYPTFFINNIQDLQITGKVNPCNTPK